MPEIKRRFWQRWDGSTKYKTLNCDACRFEVDFSEKEICGYGVSFKYLVTPKKPRRCEYYFRMEDNENCSLGYVMKAIENKLFEKEEKFIQKEIEF